MKAYRPFQILVICVLLTLPASLFSQKKKEVVTIKGTVVAEDAFDVLQACYHVCSFGLLVRLEGGEASEFVFVSVAFMDDRQLENKGSHWKLIEKSSGWKFEASASDPPTVVLKQFAAGYDAETGKDISEKIRINQWIPLKGAENVPLPYDKAIRSYSVNVGKFTPIK